MHNQLNVTVPVLPLNIMWEIDFDTVPSGFVVNNHYPGVTFEAVPLKNPSPPANFGSAFASDAYPRALADTPPNVVTIFPPPQSPAFNESGGGILVTFASPQSYVSIDALPIPDETEEYNPSVSPYLEVNGVAIQLINRKIVPHLATVYFPAAPGSADFTKWHRMEFLSPTQNIGSVMFSCSSNNGVGAPVYALFDRLRFSAHLPVLATHFLG
jgi:hypothetical protein